MQQVRRRAKIPRPRQRGGHSPKWARLRILEEGDPRRHDRRVRSRRTPRGIQRCAEPVIVIRRALVGMAVERRLQGVVVVVGLGVVDMLMKSDAEDRHATHRPQQ